MILRITNRTDELTSLDTYTLTLYDFKNREFHPFIATNPWEKVVIDLCEETPSGYIRQLLRLTRVIPVFDWDNVTPKVFNLLCEIYRQEYVQLRKVYSDKVALREYIEGMSVRYGW